VESVLLVELIVFVHVGGALKASAILLGAKKTLKNYLIPGLAPCTNPMHKLRCLGLSPAPMCQDAFETA